MDEGAYMLNNAESPRVDSTVEYRECSVVELKELVRSAPIPPRDRAKLRAENATELHTNRSFTRLRAPSLESKRDKKGRIAT